MPRRTQRSPVHATEKEERNVLTNAPSTTPPCNQTRYVRRVAFGTKTWRGSPGKSGALTMSTSQHDGR
eukprot:11227587-Lingulodinium_polyedra.AAC.1